MCKISVSQANSCQDYLLSANVTPTSRPAAQRRLYGMKFIVNSHIPEGLPHSTSWNVNLNNEWVSIKLCICIWYSSSKIVHVKLSYHLLLFDQELYSKEPGGLISTRNNAYWLLFCWLCFLFKIHSFDTMRFHETVHGVADSSTHNGTFQDLTHSAGPVGGKKFCCRQWK